jgi:hypothetical protein
MASDLRTPATPGKTGPPSLAKLQAADLQLARARAGLPAEAAAGIAEIRTVPEAVEALVAGGFLLEATRLLSHALPKREAVWWACMCARHTAPADLPEPDRLAVETAETWVRKQADELRRAAMAHGERGHFGSPEAWAAVAAFWCGDSMSPPEQPKVPPAPHLAGTAVAGAVALSAVRGDPTRAPKRLAAFIGSAREIAAGAVGRLEPETP